MVITLDQQLYPMLKEKIQAFARENRLNIAIQKGTCGISAGALKRKEADIGGFCCPPGKVDRLPGLRFHTLGISSLALIVHRDNPLANLSLADAQAIFYGDVFRWNQVGFMDNKQFIQPITRLHCKNRPGHWTLLLEDEDQFSLRAKGVGSIPDMISQVSANPRAIGYETLWMINAQRHQYPVKTVTINGHRADDGAALARGDYPLYRTYNITSWSAQHIKKESVEALIEQLIKEAGSVDSAFHLVPASRLREQGWKFSGNELTGEPDTPL